MMLFEKVQTIVFNQAIERDEHSNPISVTYIQVNGKTLCDYAEIIHLSNNFRAQMLLCKGCRISGCAPGAFIDIRKLGPYFVFAPPFDDVEEDTSSSFFGYAPLDEQFPGGLLFEEHQLIDFFSQSGLNVDVGAIPELNIGEYLHTLHILQPKLFEYDYLLSRFYIKPELALAIDAIVASMEQLNQWLATLPLKQTLKWVSRESIRPVEIGFEWGGWQSIQPFAESEQGLWAYMPDLNLIAPMTSP